MSTDSRFDRFLSNITLTQEEREQAFSRAHTVAKKLHSVYYPTRQYNGDTKLIIGSHGKRTRVRPVRDVDLIFKIPPEVFNRFDRYTGNGQSSLLQEIRRHLLDRFPSTTIKGDGPVVVATFATGHSVEVVPAAHDPATDTWWISDTRNGGSWKKSSYSAEYEQLDASDRATDGQTRRLIKMMKIWQKSRNVPIQSLCIELRAINFLKTWPHRGATSVYDDWMVRDFLRELIKYKNHYCPLPVTNERYEYGDAWIKKAEDALLDAELACEYEAKKDEMMANYMWTKIFGDQYDD